MKMMVTKTRISSEMGRVKSRSRLKVQSRSPLMLEPCCSWGWTCQLQIQENKCFLHQSSQTARPSEAERKHPWNPEQMTVETDPKLFSKTNLRGTFAPSFDAKKSSLAEEASKEASAPTLLIYGRKASRNRLRRWESTLSKPSCNGIHLNGAVDNNQSRDKSELIREDR